MISARCNQGHLGCKETGTHAHTLSVGNRKGDCACALLGTMKFTIPVHPPSVNALYQVNHKFRTVELKPEARFWKSNAKPHIPSRTDFAPFQGKKLRLTLTVRMDWYYKNKNLKRLDVTNMEKVIVDTIAEKLGFDDLLVWEISTRKVQDVTREGVDVELMVAQ